MAKPELRAKARQLREIRRLSNEEILDELSLNEPSDVVHLSTVTRWLKDIPLTTEERTAKRIASGKRSGRVALPEVKWNESMGARDKGRFAELRVQLRALQLGVTLSRPTVDAKYDYVTDTGGRLERAQVKFASGKSGANGSVVVQLSRRGKKLYSPNSIDCVLVYVPVIDRIVRLAPEEFTGKTRVSIRFKPALSGRTKGVIYAQDRFW